MSYEPIIIIYQPDLKKKEQEILHHQYGKFRRKPKTDSAKAKQLAWDKLESLLMEKGTFKIKGVVMLLVDVEFTSNNEAFRKILRDLGIEYATVN